MIIEGTATVVSSLNPAVTRLVDALAAEREPSRRRFKRYCECFEWTFNHMKRRNRQLNFIEPSVSDFVAHVDLHAGALWKHQHPSAA